ncbi:MAG: hypothetical protein JXM70_02255 [Pirellulales bacterium]|nr:hypothetical protein [Pirellulales bacterium]
MKKSLVCAVVLVSVLAANAKATLTLDWTITPNAANADAYAGGGSLDLIVGTLSADSGVIDAINVGTGGEPGFTGTFYQDMSVGTITATATYNDWGLLKPSPEVDTHFLLGLSEITYSVGCSPSENGVSPFGFGTFLGGTFDIVSSSQVSTLDFVQLYVPAGETFEYYFEVQESGQPQGIFEGTVGVPEPGMLCLLCFGFFTIFIVSRHKESK